MTPCTLRVNATTGQKGNVTGEQPAKSNKYNQNFRNKFCGCGEDYDAHQEKCTMFQCLGLGTCEDGGCGEDWWHPECLVGLSREEYRKMLVKSMVEKAKGDEKMSDGEMPKEKVPSNGNSVHSEPSAITAITSATENNDNGEDNDVITGNEEQDEEEEDPPLPPGFPAEDDFDHFICYKCVAANPWIKKYAGTAGFLPPVYFDTAIANSNFEKAKTPNSEILSGQSKKRKASEDNENESTPSEATLAAQAPAKRQKSEGPGGTLASIAEDTITLPITPKKQEEYSKPKHTLLPPLAGTALTTPFSLFLEPEFRDHLCRCPDCFPLLKPHPQLLEEEDTYEPPVSESGEDGPQSVGTGSLLDRGEAAFNNMDRVRAIQGAMAYAHLKDKVAAFLKPFAESGQAVGAEDVKAYFEKLRGDEQGIQDAAGGAEKSRDDGDGDGEQGGSAGGGRTEQSGY